MSRKNKILTLADKVDMVIKQYDVMAEILGFISAESPLKFHENHNLHRVATYYRLCKKEMVAFKNKVKK